MGYITIQDAAKKWEISERRIQVLCTQNRLKGARKFGRYWAIPDDLEKPDDARVKTGRYIKKSSDPEIDNKKLTKEKRVLMRKNNDGPGITPESVL